MHHTPILGIELGWSGCKTACLSIEPRLSLQKFGREFQFSQPLHWLVMHTITYLLLTWRCLSIGKILHAAHASAAHWRPTPCNNQRLKTNTPARPLFPCTQISLEKAQLCWISRDRDGPFTYHLATGQNKRILRNGAQSWYTKLPQQVISSDLLLSYKNGT